MVDFLMPLTVAAPLSFLLQYAVEVEKYKLLSPKASYFLVVLNPTYDVEPLQNLFCNSFQEIRELELIEKTLETLNNNITFYTCFRVFDRDFMRKFWHSFKKLLD